MTTAAEVEVKLDGHVDVCAVRYAGIETQMAGMNARLKRLEHIGMTCAGTIILLLLNLVLKAHG